ALIISPDQLRALLIAEAELGERIMRALILRRVGLLETGAGEREGSKADNRRASVLYFAAAVPTVGFVHGATDLSPLNGAALEGYAEDRFIKRTPRIDTAACGKCSTTSPQSSRRWPLALQWLA